ncbi:MAG TPA: APC family permease, partial [Actinomycetes bacterium]|nr:APC family permease [Actinomycetes bacterium]
MATDLEPDAAPKLRAIPQPDAEDRYQSLGYRAKRALLGPPFKTAQLAHERISKRVALAVFSSDPISSTAYATEEMLLVLVVAGTAAVGLALPLAAGVAVLLLILVLSYRQVIAAYPQGGGAYMVTRDNLGGSFAAVCAAALLVDYVLTVAVSVSAGTAALSSAIPALQDLRVEISVAFIILLMWGNLRGARESGKIFAVPTYVYILSLGGVVVLGVYRVLSGQIDPIAYDPAKAQDLAGFGEPLAVVSLFLLMHAYAAGTTALTGVEAIADGVPAFKKPEAQNAQRTLVAMALIMGFLFIGITYLAIQLDARPFEAGHPTLVAQITQHVLGGGIGQALFVFVQIATLFILVLAANTAFNGFPILASFAAQDALMPRQLRKRGHRLVYSNGILVLAAGAVFLVIAFKASVHALIPLYAIGVVTSFTLSQSGMARRHLRLREPGWRKGLLINGAGALITLVVLVVIAVTKFADGAWMVCVAIPLLVLLLQRVQRTYRAEVT